MTPEDGPGYAALAATLLADIADALLGGSDLGGAEWRLLHRLRAALDPDTASIRDILGRPDPDMIKEAMEKGLSGYHAAPTSGDVLKSIYSEKIREQLSSHEQMSRMLDMPMYEPTPPSDPAIGSLWVDTTTSTTSNPAAWSYSVNRRKGKAGSA